MLQIRMGWPRALLATSELFDESVVAHFFALRSPMNELQVHPIGIIHSPHRSAVGAPIQPVYARQFEGTVVVDASYTDALDDVDGFDRVWIIYWFDRAKPFNTHVVPYRDDQPHGLFATRSPSRPNPIGLSSVRLLKREGCVLHVAEIDILDGTPLLDIKPYVAEFDAHPGARAGWLDAPGNRSETADNRFHGR